MKSKADLQRDQQPKSTLLSRLFESRSADWTRTPAAIFASIFLGLVSVGGVVWSIQRAQQIQEPIVPESIQVSDEPMGVIHLVDINSANAQELDLLPEIGPSLASRIVEDRETHGRFETIESLDRVKGIGPKTIEKIRALVILGD